MQTGRAAGNWPLRERADFPARGPAFVREKAPKSLKKTKRDWKVTVTLKGGATSLKVWVHRAFLYPHFFASGVQLKTAEWENNNQKHCKHQIRTVALNGNVSQRSCPTAFSKNISQSTYIEESVDQWTKRLSLQRGEMHHFHWFMNISIIPSTTSLCTWKNDDAQDLTPVLQFVPPPFIFQLCTPTSNDNSPVEYF